MLDIYIVIEYNMNVMNNYNKTKIFYILFSLISLLSGAAIYVFFREGTYIHHLLPQAICRWTEPARQASADVFLVDVLKYYLSDFLWCFSLNFLLLSVIDFKKQSYSLAVAVVSALWGILFEVAQCLGIVTGTFDFADIIMYILASVSVAMINKKLIKRMN